MLFAGGRRILGSRGPEFVLLHYRPGGWVCEGWVDDEYDARAEREAGAPQTGAAAGSEAR